MKINIIQCKTLLTKSRLPETDYCINPYVGCLHGCVYCYARFMKRFTGHDEPWGHFLDVKINAPEVLAKELSRKPKRGVVLLGSVTDAYQPVEQKYRITRTILKILLQHDFPVSVLTKSNLVVRDLDLFKQFSQCEVGLTVTTTEQGIARNFEPHSSTPKQRIEALDTLHRSGITTYAFIGPILPELTDLEAIFAAISGKVDFVMAESLNLRCGNWENIQDLLKNKYPHLLSLYQSRFPRTYWTQVEKELRILSEKFKIPLKGFYRH
ncbi:MAG TPA: radical SAM protein [Candidatus Paceibacterota bacterium]|nr:radical SAM protein [Candidatus Paceibacterota bacterium]